MDKIKPRTREAPNYLILLLGLAILLAGYALLRYAGWWGEGDTARFTKAIAAMMESGDLIPAKLTYANGYGYQVLMAWLAAFTGLPLGVLQLAGGTLLMIWVVVPAWLAFRDLTRSELAASLATLILLVQPEFLFALLRGTHEKFTRGLMFMCLYLLLRSMRTRRVRLFTLLIVCFYLCAYAMVSFNTFMATSFILGILLALGLVWLIGRWSAKTRQEASPLVMRLFYVTTILLVIAFIFTFYAYPPAQGQLNTLMGVGDRLALLALQVEDTASNPYQVVNTGWVSLPVYYLVSLANWLLLGLSLVIWLKQSYAWLVKRRFQPARHEILLWAFYGAFACLGVISILVDVSGAIASNLQHRIFPTFTMIAAPVAGAWLARLKFTGSKRQKSMWTATSLALGGLMLLSVIKATNEPLLSNYWPFNTPAELQAIKWAEQNFPPHSLEVRAWGRPSAGYSIRENGRIFENELGVYLYQFTTHNYLISDVIRLYAQQVRSQLPVQADSLRTYDNGTAQFYHRRPVTPFQK